MKTNLDHTFAYVAKADDLDIEPYHLLDKYVKAIKAAGGKVGKVLGTDREKVYSNINSTGMVYIMELPDGSIHHIFNDFVWHPTKGQIKEYEQEVKRHAMLKELPELEGIF